jgi:hypothetical protein
VPGVELAGVAASAGAASLWINPGGPHGGRLDRRMVDVVAAGRTMSLEVDGGETLRLRTTGVGELHVRAPQAPPAEALERLRAAVAAASARGAWLVEVTVPPPAHLLLVLDLAPDASTEAALTGVREAAAGLVPPDRFVDIMPVPGGDGEVVARAREVGLPVTG